MNNESDEEVICANCGTSLPKAKEVIVAVGTIPAMSKEVRICPKCKMLHDKNGIEFVIPESRNSIFCMKEQIHIECYVKYTTKYRGEGAEVVALYNQS